MTAELSTSLPSPADLRKALLNDIDVPLIFKNLAEHFPAVPWTLSDLEKHGNIELDFRIVSKGFKGISWEGNAEFVQATVPQFVSWQAGDILSDENPFKVFDKHQHWAYSSYNYMNGIFPEDSEIVKDTNWSRFGFPEVTGNDCTFWLGSIGAYTPCHSDSYGCNLVLQVLGRKKWTLFPPPDRTFLYPTRIPYEESSVFSSVNILDPDLVLHPLFKCSQPHVVILEPGDVLFVPSKWWHFVESLDEITTSINTWIKLDSDCHNHLEESLTRALMSSLISYYEPEGENWFNPKEEEVPPEENLMYINSSLKELKIMEGSQSLKKSALGEKVLKTMKESDVSQQCKSPVNLFDFEGISKVDCVPFCEWLGKPTPAQASAGLPSSDITLQKMVDCFVHPEVIAVISRLIKQL
ncbi:hypothetical protein JTE90_011630 [Oedothorax gibbosus]|uniref:JmjC domain-containing protein n=1 Tax=Oedothorax gibbosus TaxID=931172 RepID=A0AAV6U4Y9_9ARAC|nr:hypothetical protein JTE90_011630 [Oedothorax gibbosus]